MLTLYSKNGCPYCEVVKDFFIENKVLFQERKVDENEEYLKELIELGKKRQVPFLVDNLNGVSMYESSSMISHVEEKFL